MKKIFCIIFCMVVILCGCEAGTQEVSKQEETTQEKMTEEVTTEEPIMDELTTEEPTTEEPTTEEATTEEPTTEEPTAEESITEEPTTEEATTEEAITEEATTEKPTTVAYDKSRDEYYSELVEQAKKDGRKVVYLTFDDGPSKLTPQVMEILDEYNVKATFFVVGMCTPSEEAARNSYTEVIKRGHSLGIHSFTHDRGTIYLSLDEFSKDCDKMYEYVYNLVGYKPFLWRFPGGSKTMYADSRMNTEYIPYINRKGLEYYDWNVSSGDGSSETKRDDIYRNVITGVSNKDVSVVLMHDGFGREETVAALPDILNTLINEMNCLVVPITESTTPIHAKS